MEIRAAQWVAPSRIKYHLKLVALMFRLNNLNTIRYCIKERKIIKIQLSVLAMKVIKIKFNFLIEVHYVTNADDQFFQEDLPL